MFAEPLTDLDRYWAGYLRADGTIVRVSSDRGSLKFGQTMLEPVQALREYSGTKGKLHVYDKPGGFESKNKGYVIIIGSKDVYKRAIELGIKDNLREDLFMSPDFWRGMIDGDGSLGVYEREGHLYPTISLCSKNIEDLNRFSDFCESLGLTRPVTAPSRSLFVSRYTYWPAKYLAWRLYRGQYSANPAKKKNAEKIIQLDLGPRKSSKISDELRAQITSV